MKDRRRRTDAVRGEFGPQKKQPRCLCQGCVNTTSSFQHNEASAPYSHRAESWNRSKIELQHGRSTTTNNAATTPSSIRQLTHHTRTSTAHGREPSQSKSTTPATRRYLQILQQCLRHRRPEAASQRPVQPSATHRPECSITEQRRHHATRCPQVPEVRRVRLQQNDRYQRWLHDSGG